MEIPSIKENNNNYKNELKLLDMVHIKVTVIHCKYE